MKCSVLLYSVVYPTREEGIGIELGKESKRMSDVASASAVGYLAGSLLRMRYCCLPTQNVTECRMKMET
jgi:hypothetical protein